MKKHIPILVSVILVGFSMIGIVGMVGAQQGGEDSVDPSVSFTKKTTGGYIVNVDKVVLPNGGFVTIHDSTLTDGKTLESVRGSSSYLEPGTHTDVEVYLEDPVRNNDMLFAMLHKDTDNDWIYSFVSSNGKTDTPYTKEGNIVMQKAQITTSSTIKASNQSTNGRNILIDKVELSNGGFVTIHDGSLQNGEVFDSILGTSQYLGPGIHRNIRVNLDSPVSNDTLLIPMAHKDTNNDEKYKFKESKGENDGPYTTQGGPVIDKAYVDLKKNSSIEFTSQSSGGHIITIKSSYIPMGGFVTIHDGSLQNGEVFDSIRGTSKYLKPGLHRNIQVVLDNPINSSQTLIPMAHKDTDNDKKYTFKESKGENDGPYISNGNPVVDTGNVTVSASISIEKQVSDGKKVKIQNVDLSNGGFVTIHDGSLQNGEVFDSILGTSQYLGPGIHRNIMITLEDSINSSQTLIPMAHKDTDNDEMYSFDETNGENDGPYTYMGGAVIDIAKTDIKATVTLNEQEANNGNISVASATLHNGGFVTIHDGSLQNGEVFDSILGTSQYLGPGTHKDIDISLDRQPSSDEMLIAMPHKDTDNNQQYTFKEDEGKNDGPYISDFGAIVDDGLVMFESMDNQNRQNMNSTQDTSMEQDTNTDQQNTDTDQNPQPQPGFNVLIGLISLLSIALIIRIYKK